MPTDLLPALGAHVVQWHDRWRIFKSSNPAAETFFFLSGLSGSFWFLSLFFSYAAIKIHDALDESLGALLAVSYNVALGVAFSSVLTYAIIQEKGGSDHFLAYQAAGFVFSYIVLGAIYSERTGEISEYAILGYVAGLASYLLFCVHSQYLTGRLPAKGYAAVRWVTHGWLGKIAVVLTVTQAGVFVRHAVLRLIGSAGSRLRRRRPFFKRSDHELRV